MKLTTLEDNDISLGCGCTKNNLNDNVFTPVPGIDAPVSCGRCGHSPCRCGGRGANTVTQNPVINVNVGNKGSNGGFQLPSMFPSMLPQSNGANNQYVDELIQANKRISDLEHQPPKVEVQKVERPVIIDRKVPQIQKVYTTVPIDRIKAVKQVVDKIIPLDRIKTMFKKQDVVIPLEKIKYANPNTQRSSFEGEYK